MQPSPEIFYDSNEVTPITQGQYTLLLHDTETTQDTLYFTLPDQDDYLYEYEGDLEEALDDLPQLYEAETTYTSMPALSPQAAVVVEQIWNYFDQTGEQELEGEQDYNFRVVEDHLQVMPKDNPDQFITVDRNGQIESTLEPEQYGQLMERFAIAYQQIRMTSYQQDNEQDFELK